MRSLGDPSWFVPVLRVGQWWALRNPLGLARIECGDMPIGTCMPEDSTVLLKVWNARISGEEWNFVSMPDAEWLSCVTYSTPEALNHRDLKLGDCILIGHDEHAKLAFIGPESPQYKGKVCVLTSWRCTEEDCSSNFVRIYQPVHRPETPSPTAYDMLLSDD